MELIRCNNCNCLISYESSLCPYCGCNIINQIKIVKELQKNKSKGVFYCIIALLTFIVMGVGATFAYFTATTSSVNTSVQTGSTTLELKYISYGETWQNDDLIQTTK